MEGKPQKKNVGTCHRTREVEGIDEVLLNQKYSAQDLINLLRARTFPPYRGAYFVYKGKRVFMKLALEEEA